MRRYDLFGIGTALVDSVAKVGDDFIKKLGLKKEATNYVTRDRLNEILGDLGSSLFSWPGDNARNVCEGIAFMGGKAAYAGRIGGDQEGVFFEKVLKRLGIESFLEVGPGKTGRIITLVTPDMCRTFVADLGNGNGYSSVPEYGIKSSKYLFLTSITMLNGKISEVAEKALDIAKKSGVSVSISLESAPMILENRERLVSEVAKSDVLFGNEMEISALTGMGAENGAKKLARRIPIICLKMGERGSKIFSGGRIISVPPHPASVRDPTGAGDYYAAGFIFGMIRGKTVEECGEMGAKLASMAIENLCATLTEREDHDIYPIN
ncbi:MAG: adenosine kinase [Candidatus Hadarchaeales archaeon]